MFTLSSNAATAIPEVAPEPASPMKCSLPMLLANSDAPTFRIEINKIKLGQPVKLKPLQELVCQHWFGTRILFNRHESKWK